MPDIELYVVCILIAAKLFVIYQILRALYALWLSVVLGRKNESRIGDCSNVGIIFHPL